MLRQPIGSGYVPVTITTIVRPQLRKNIINFSTFKCICQGFFHIPMTGYGIDINSPDIHQGNGKGNIDYTFPFNILTVISENWS